MNDDEHGAVPHFERARRDLSDLVGKTLAEIHETSSSGAGEFPQGEVLLLFFTDGDVLQIEMDVNQAELEAAQSRTPRTLGVRRCDLRTHFIIRRWRTGPPVAEVPEAFRVVFDGEEVTPDG
jgi:hypothetical protein